MNTALPLLCKVKHVAHVKKIMPLGQSLTRSRLPDMSIYWQKNVRCSPLDRAFRLTKVLVTNMN